MGEIVNIEDYRRTCHNCIFWEPPKMDGNRILKDSSCGHPGGWTPVYYGPPGPYQRMECSDFKRKRKERTEE